MNQNNIIEMSAQESHFDPLTELLRKAARDLIHSAVEAEVSALLEEMAHIKTS